MTPILDLLSSHERRRFGAGEIVIEQGTRTGLLFVLVEGAVEVVKNDVHVATTSEPGAVFGELSALLGSPHTATVRATRPSVFSIVPDPRSALDAMPQLCLHVCELLAHRLNALNKYLVNVKHQYEGQNHIGAVDDVLEALMHRQYRPHIRPSDSTVSKGELPD